MTAPPERALKRILVALDASRASLDALVAAAALAERLGAELGGLFVEDEILLSLGGHPFVRQMRLPSGDWGPLEPGSIEADLRAMASRAREALARAAAPRRVTWTFRVARGRVSLEVIAASEHADLLVLGVSGHRLTRGPGETARAAAARAPVSVLLLTRGATVGPPILAAYDGSPAGDRALDLAARLAAAGAGELEVLVAARDLTMSQRLAEQARRRLDRPGARARWAGGGRLEDLVAAAPPHALLVVGADAPALAEGGPERLLALARCPVLLAR
ncbi:MAG TPA: universal stress protein [Anaeromyxobacteraceae bacterium]|nr:universal stress protein [Anaeromyxobacteraceae bacterium]